MNKILNNGIYLRNGKYSRDTVTAKDMSDMASTAEMPARISDNRYRIALEHMNLLRSMNEIDNAEVKRLISLLKSPDHENWLVAEQCIEKLLS